jgi:hypothetical protein
LSEGLRPSDSPTRALARRSWFDCAHHALSTVEGRRRAPLAWLARGARSHPREVVFYEIPCRSDRATNWPLAAYSPDTALYLPANSRSTPDVLQQT